MRARRRCAGLPGNDRTLLLQAGRMLFSSSAVLRDDARYDEGVADSFVYGKFVERENATCAGGSHHDIDTLAAAVREIVRCRRFLQRALYEAGVMLSGAVDNDKAIKRAVKKVDFYFSWVCSEQGWNLIICSSST